MSNVGFGPERSSSTATVADISLRCAKGFRIDRDDRELGTFRTPRCKALFHAGNAYKQERRARGTRRCHGVRHKNGEARCLPRSYGCVRSCPYRQTRILTPIWESSDASGTLDACQDHICWGADAPAEQRRASLPSAQYLRGP